MQIDEKILLVIGAVALVALVLFNQNGIGQGILAGVTQAPADNVPSYLGAAQMSPFAFAPPVGNVLPYTSQGEVGQASTATDSTYAQNYATAGCGCGMG